MFKTIISHIRRKHHFDRYKIVKRLISKKGKELLDIGCGSPARCVKEGSFLRTMGYGQGIDIEKRDIEFPFKIGDMQDIPFKDNKFGVVTAIEVIEHVGDPVKAINEVHRILKDNGIFVMTTPNNNWFFRIFWRVWENTVGKEWHDTHLSATNKRQWINLIRKTGKFKIIKVIDYWGVNIIVKMRKV